MKWVFIAFICKSFILVIGRNAIICSHVLKQHVLAKEPFSVLLAVSNKRKWKILLRSKRKSIFQGGISNEICFVNNTAQVKLSFEMQIC
jgi:hypothetical protein